MAEDEGITDDVIEELVTGLVSVLADGLTNYEKGLLAGDQMQILVDKTMAHMEDLWESAPEVALAMWKATTILAASIATEVHDG